VVIRHFILTSHYRQPIDFSNDALKAAESGSHKLRDAARELSRAAQEAPAKPQSDSVRTTLAELEKRFSDAMNEDFNTAAAIATVFDLAKQAAGWIHGGVGREDLLAADTLMRRLTGDVLGFKWPAPLGEADESKQNELIQLLADLRNDARRQKDFALADQIRERLGALGVHLRDTPEGTTW
jgi:cysteinyl-tRNA synthetase